MALRTQRKKEALTREVDRRRLRGEEITMELMLELQDRLDQGDLFEEVNEDTENDGAPTEAVKDSGKPPDKAEEEENCGRTPSSGAEETRQA